MNLTRQLTAAGVPRRVQPATDAESYVAAQDRCREQLRPYEPIRQPEWYTPGFHVARFQKMVDNDTQVPWVLATEHRVIGTINLTNIVLGAWRNADLGYWV